MGKITLSEKEGLVKIANREALIDTSIIREGYPLSGFVSYLYYFSCHFYEQLKERIVTLSIDRKS